MIAPQCPDALLTPARDIRPMIFRFRFEFGSGCLWPGDAAAVRFFGTGPLENHLPLSAATRHRLWELAEWHDRSRSRSDQAAPCLWRQWECDRFNAAAAAALALVRAELGPGYHVVDGQPLMREDPGLDTWLGTVSVTPGPA